MLRKLLISGVMAAGIVMTASAADVIIRTAPPRPVVEERVASPGPGYVWEGGYHRWDGHAYVWVPGKWERPPRERARWVAPHYVHRHGGYVFVEGRWR